MKHDSAFIRAGERVCPVDDLSAHVSLRPCNITEVIFAVDLERLRAFRRQTNRAVTSERSLLIVLLGPCRDPFHDRLGGLDGRGLTS